MDKLTVTREHRPDDIAVTIGPSRIGNGEFLLIAGPCAVETPEQMAGIVAMLAGNPAGMLRGGAFKPRTSPYAFQGLGRDGLVLLREAADRLGIPVLTEVTDTTHLELVLEFADAIQIGSRNMSAYELLKAVGRQSKPVVLKRGMAATVREFLYAAEYIVAGGNEQIILCERGIRSFDPTYRNVVDLNTVAWLKAHCPFPVVVDPSHGSGRVDLVTPLSRAAIAAGADGLMVEVHPNPGCARSDGDQSLDPAAYRDWHRACLDLARFMGRTC